MTEQSSERTLFALVDSPTAQTGFARVSENLLKRWDGFFSRMEVWGINYTGFPHNIPYLQNSIYPAGGADWSSPARLTQFLNVLLSKQPTHVWILQDTFMMSRFDFPEELFKACTIRPDGVEGKEAESFMYFPVDAPLDQQWMEIIEKVNCAVAYTEYGKREAIKALGKQYVGQRGGEVTKGKYNVSSMSVIPHGTDPAVYHPIENRDQVRASFFKGWLKPSDKLLVYVGAHQRRKSLGSLLELIAALRKKGREDIKLYIHSPNECELEQTTLDQIGRQCGLTHGVEWLCASELFKLGHALMTEKGLNEVYNAADCFVTTTLGEGWGLPITEALFAGIPVCAPDHTAVAEIHHEVERLGFKDRMSLMPLSSGGTVQMIDNSRLRHPIDVDASVEVIEEALTRPVGVRPNAAVVDWLDWNRIAKLWLKKFGWTQTEIDERYQNV